MPRRTLGLALGSGSYRGLAHIGLIKVLEENEVPIDYLSGSSIGSVIGSLYASGMTGGDIEEIALQFVQDPPFTISVDPGKAFIIFIKAVLKRIRIISSDWIKVPKGLIDGKEVYNYLCSYLGDKRFDQLKKCLIVVSTDLVSGEGIAFVPGYFPAEMKSLQNMVYYYNERVVDAVQASISIPGIFVPFSFEQRLLVDGAVKNSVPVDVLSLLKPDVIVGVDLGYDSQADDKIEDPLAVAIQTLDIMGQEISELNLGKYADIIIRPEVKNISLKDITTITDAINAGKRAGTKAIPAIKAMLGIK